MARIDRLESCMVFMNIGMSDFHCICDYMTLIQRYLHLTNSIRKKSRLLDALG